MEIYKLVDEIETWHDLVKFIGALRDDLVQRPNEWENPTLERFLDALAAWTTDMNGYFQYRGETVPSQPS